MQEITVTIHNGSTKIAVKGVKGKGCEALTRDLEAALGGVKKRSLTAEHKQASQTAGQKAVAR